MSQDVSSTKLFKQVDIKPLISQAEGNRVPVQVTLSNRVDHEIETGIGYATDVGPRLSATWEKPWVNRYGHRLSSTAKIRRRKRSSASTTRSRWANPLRDYYSPAGGLSIHRQQRHPLRSGHLRGAPLDTPTGELGQRRLCAPGERALRPGSGRGEQPAADPRRLLVTAARVRGGLVPDWGSPATDDGVLESLLGSDISFMRVWGRSKWLRTLGKITVS